MSGETALRERAQLLDELRQIVQSMKNLAFAELQRVSRMKQAQMQARDAVAQALQDVRSGAPVDTDSQARPATWLVIGAERGFCGAFNTPLARASMDLLSQNPDVQLLIASHRLLAQLEDGAPGVVALPGCAASDEAELVLDTWLEAVNSAIRKGYQVWLMHVGSEGPVQQALWPVESDQSSTPASRAAPQMYLPVATLREALTHQALRLAIQGALYASLEQENHWRLAQMQRAQDHLDELGRTLRRRYASLRQANITNELETLASSTMGSPTS